jgi:RNA polymerase sigma-70 factor (ECF subfamily)
VVRARTGDLDAFEAIVRARTDAVYRLSLAILGNEADARDATQETLVAAWRQLPRLREPERFEAWLQRIAVNTARMTLRSRSRRRVREITSGGDVRTPPAVPGPDADARVLGLALERLGFDPRAVLGLHPVEGRPVAEIADLLGIPVGTVKSRLFHARQALDRAIVAAEHE